MPTESSNTTQLNQEPILPTPQGIKCSRCGAASLGPADGVIILGEQMSRVCASCVRFSSALENLIDDVTGVEKVQSRRSSIAQVVGNDASEANPPPLACLAPVVIPSLTPRQIDPAQSQSQSQSQSLPAQSVQPWNTVQRPLAVASSPVAAGREISASPLPTPDEESEGAPNPLLDVTRARVRSNGRGCLYPGSVFKGSQTSGRSAYEVEIRLIDVNFAQSTLNGYLSISHLTDSHPHLTTFFVGEIIGPKFGFITGERYGATEHDDMRHWGRFEQFRRPTTRVDISRSEMLFRDPVPDKSSGESRSRERDFVFLRIKEKFLVPDHHVRDISGASFAGFYYAMVDLSESVRIDDAMATSSVAPKSPLSSTSTLPTNPRRQSASGRGTRSTSAGSSTPLGVRRQSTTQGTSRHNGTTNESTIRGYYFHSLNQEPFQELFLTHVPSFGNRGTFELR